MECFDVFLALEIHRRLDYIIWDIRIDRVLTNINFARSTRARRRGRGEYGEIGVLSYFDKFTEGQIREYFEL
jgi:hypothetical protein